MENQVLFYILTEEQKDAFVAYAGYNPFTEYQGMWYITAEAADANGTTLDLLEFDDQDSVSGDDYTSYWWNISTIPSVLWP